jgi:hypothetical protein
MADNSNNKATVVESYIAPDPNATNPTPQQVNSQTQQESDKSTTQQTVTNTTQVNPEVTTNNTPSDLQPQGSAKLAIVLNKKRSELKRILIPMLVALATQIGIKYIGTLKPKIPKTCLTKPELDSIILKRNRIVEKLNQIVKIIDTFTKILAGVTLIIGIVTTLVATLKNSRLTISIASKFIPAPPGIPGSIATGLNDLKDAQEEATNRLTKLTTTLATVTLSLATINAVLLKIISMLNSIDKYIQQCAPDASLVSLSPTLLDLERVNNEINNNINAIQTYKGFTLEIVEEPYSPTVNRRKAVAKNKEGIILLSTPLSFTTDTETLINEIKLIIDSNDLKAY